MENKGKFQEMKKLNWLFSLILVVSCLLPFAILPEPPVLADTGKETIVLESPIELRDMGSYYRIFNGAKTYHFGKNGINEIWSYDESVLMLDNEQFRIEVGGVVKAYSSVEVSYKVVSAGHYEVIQTYVCDKAQYTSVYTIKYGQPLTAECTVKSGEKQDYKVLWDFDGTSSYENITNGIKYDNGLNIRWDDVKATLGDITSVKTYLDKSQTKVDAISFNIGNIDAGKELKLDPVAGGGNTYWVNGSGNWSDGANHWSDSSGGAANASYVPGADSPVFFDGNSSLGVGWTVTVNAAAYCKSLDFTGATNSPTFTLSGYLSFYGSATFIAAMTYTNSAYEIISRGTGNLTTNGLSIRSFITLSAGSNLTLLDNLTFGERGIEHLDGTLNTNGFTVTIPATYSYKARGIIGVKVLTLGSSIFNTGIWEYSGSNLTITANTATINCSGNFAGGGITTYNVVNLTGATSTGSGNNTFSQLNLVSGTTQTITFTAGTTQNVSSASLSGSAGHVHTLTSAGNWSIVDTNGGTNSASYVALRGSQASGGTFIADYHSTDNGNNSGWIFQKSLTTTHTGTGSITTPAGDGTFIYNESTVATLVAAAGTCYHFVNWTGDTGTIADATDATTTITMNDHYAIVANFAITTYNLTVASDPKGLVSTPAIGVTTYNCGTSVPITAVPNSGYVFGGWTGDTATIADTTDATTTITISGNYSITATYTLDNLGVWTVVQILPLLFVCISLVLALALCMGENMIAGIILLAIVVIFTIVGSGVIFSAIP